MKPFLIQAYGTPGSATNATNTLAPMQIERQPPAADQVLIEVLYCGVCHSDLHQVRNDWQNTIYPCVPGHEVVGRVIETGADVTQVAAGDLVGVGCMIDSCGHCASCREGDEQYCEGPVGWTGTYNGYLMPDGSGFNTYGGYSTHLVVRDAFVVPIPAGLSPQEAAPILCAGVTVWSPLKHWQIGTGHHIAVVGLGGLGHMAVQLARARGARVTVLTTSADKEADALGLGADAVVLSTDRAAMRLHTRAFDFILTTIPDPFNVAPYLNLLKRNGVLITVGLLVDYERALSNQKLAFHRRSVAGSLIGSIAETREVLQFCADHGIRPEIEVIPMQQINGAFDTLKAGDVRFRYVIDMQSLKA